MTKKILTALCTLSFLFAPASFAKRTVDFTKWTTPEGLLVYYVSAPEIPMVDITLAFAAGSARDGERPGIANLTNELLLGGAGKLDANQLAIAFDEVGATVQNEVGREMATMHLRTLSDKNSFEPALATFTTVLSKPTFPDTAISRERNKQLAAIKQMQQSPSDIATELFFKTLYNTHPYGHPVIGDEASVGKITRDEIVTFHHQYYNSANAVLVIVGDIDKKNAEQLARDFAKQLPSGVKAPTLPTVPGVTQANNQMHPFPATQSNIRIGQIGIARQSPDFFTTLVGNYVLGGQGLNSRLFTSVRENNGLAYAVNSSFVPMQTPGPFVISLGTRREKANLALDITRQTLKKFIDEGPTAAELVSAKKYLTGSFPNRISTNSDISKLLVAIGFYGMPDDYLDTYIQHVNDVTAEQIRGVFQKTVHPDKMVTIQVGNSTASGVHANAISATSSHHRRKMARA